MFLINKVTLNKGNDRTLPGDFEKKGWKMNYVEGKDGTVFIDGRYQIRDASRSFEEKGFAIYKRLTMESNDYAILPGEYFKTKEEAKKRVGEIMAAEDGEHRPGWHGSDEEPRQQVELIIELKDGTKRAGFYLKDANKFQRNVRKWKIYRGDKYLDTDAVSRWKYIE